MWPFNKKTLETSGIFAYMIDSHCHILPGVDDGVQRMYDSLGILNHYEELGVEEVWLTPHIMEDVPNTTQALRERFAQLTATYNGPVKLHLSAENMLDNLFRERLEAGDVLPWGRNENHLLVETSCVHAPSNFHELLEDIKKKGYFPILAHPERYMYMNRLEYQALKQRKVDFQLNLFSLLGMYGKYAKENAEFLLDEGLYTYVGTDLHDHRVLDHALRQKLSKKRISQIAQILK